jgi:hypothetical protein
LDLGATPGVSRVLIEGGLDAQTIRLEGNIGSRTVGGGGITNHCAGPERAGVCIEAPFSGQFSSVKALKTKATRHRQRRRQEARDAGGGEGEVGVSMKDDTADGAWLVSPRNPCACRVLIT